MTSHTDKLSAMEAYSKAARCPTDPKPTPQDMELGWLRSDLRTAIELQSDPARLRAALAALKAGAT